MRIFNCSSWLNLLASVANPSTANPCMFWATLNLKSHRISVQIAIRFEKMNKEWAKFWCLNSHNRFYEKARRYTIFVNLSPQPHWYLIGDLQNNLPNMGASFHQDDVPRLLSRGGRLYVPTPGLPCWNKGQTCSRVSRLQSLPFAQRYGVEVRASNCESIDHYRCKVDFYWLLASKNKQFEPALL